MLWAVYCELLFEDSDLVNSLSVTSTMDWAGVWAGTLGFQEMEMVPVYISARSAVGQCHFLEGGQCYQCRTKEEGELLLSQPLWIRCSFCFHYLAIYWYNTGCDLGQTVVFHPPSFILPFLHGAQASLPVLSYHYIRYSNMHWEREKKEEDR